MLPASPRVHSPTSGSEKIQHPHVHINAGLLELPDGFWLASMKALSVDADEDSWAHYFKVLSCICLATYRTFVDH